MKYHLKATSNKAWSGYNDTKAGAGCLDVFAAIKGTTTQTTNTGITASSLLTTGSDPINWGSVQWGSCSGAVCSGAVCSGACAVGQ